MPAASSMIRRVPGGNVGPASGCWADGMVGSVGVALPDFPARSVAPTTATRTSSESPMIQGVRLAVLRGAGGWNEGVAGGTGGDRTGELCTVTPGPAGVATSDQLTPFHHRTIPDAPSGSGYHPGAGCAGPVTGPA